MPSLSRGGLDCRARAAIAALFFTLSPGLTAQVPRTPSSNVPAKTPPQVQQALPSYEGQNVDTVEVAGRPDIDLQKIQSLLAQKPGEPFSQAKVDQSVANLKSQGGFQDVQIQLVPDINGVRVLLVLQPGMYFGMYDFQGALRSFSYTRLLQVANYPPEGPYSKVDVDRAVKALLTFFRRSGYFNARITPEVQSDAAHGIVNVDFRTQLGRKARFGNVTLEGADARQTARLQSRLKSVMARLRGAAIRKGKTYSPKTLANATQYLEGQLRKNDFLGARVRLLGAAYDPETNRADISMHVQTGPPVKVKVAGAHLWPWTRKKLLPVYEQIGIDQELIQEGRLNLRSYFQSKGYFDSDVAVNVQQNGPGESILYQVTKGPRHKVTGVSLAGNKAISEDDLEPRIAVKKGRFFSHGQYSEKLVAKSVKNLEGIYRIAGFSAAKVTPQVKNEGGNISIVFRVDEGPQDIVSSLTLDGNTLSPAQLAPKGLNVTEGRPYSQKLVDEDRDLIMARYLELGYLTATFRAIARPVSAADPHHLALTYRIYEGPQVITSSVITLGQKVTRKSFIARTAPLSVGTPMSANETLTAGSRLYTPGIFDWAEVDPRREVTTQNREDLVVKVHEAKRNQLRYGFGFEVINRGGSIPSGTVAVPGLPPVGLSKDFKTSEKTFYGPRGSLQYTRRNLRGKAETLNVSILGGRLLQRGTFSYLDPNLRGTDWASDLSVSGEHNEENPIFSSRQEEAGFQIQRALDSAKTQNLFLHYDFRDTRLTRLLLADLIPAVDQHVRLSTVSSTYTRDKRDNVLDAHKGIYQSYEFDLNPAALGSSVSFTRFIGQTAYYFGLPKKMVWANSIRLGLENAFAGSHVPVSERFFSGGGSTLRGFPLNGAGPQRTISACGTTQCFPINVPTGGNQLFIVNSELRSPLPIKQGLGIVGFYDGGNVFRDVGFHGQYTNTLGVGLRYETPVGPIRIDLGHNLNAAPGIKATQLFITLGQSF